MALAVVLLLLIAGTIAFHFLSPWWFTPIASNWTTVDVTVNITFVVTGIVFVLINVFMAYCVFKFKYNENNRSEYEPENKKLEVGLTIFTSIGVILMLAPGLFVWANFVDPPDDATEVEVLGQQWRWAYRYPGEDGVFGSSDVSHLSVENPFGLNPDDPKGQDDILVYDDSLRLQKDQPVKILLRSIDVLHNFTVPQFRVKMDLVPGMVTYIWLTPTKTGGFDIMCEELCGLAHFSMRGRVVVEEEPQFNAWLATQKTFAKIASEEPPNIAKGEALYDVCSSCHGQKGEGNVALNAPRLAGLSDWYIKNQIKKFKNGMRGSHKEDLYGSQMIPIAKNLDGEAAIKDVATYIGTFAETSTNSTIIGNVENGRRLYTSCGACHGKDGKGIWSVNAPRLAGTDDWYLVRQLNNYQQKIRGTHPSDATGKQMMLFSSMLKNKQSINDVVAYINTLQ